MEKHREIYEGLRPLKSTCCEDSDSQPCPNKILYVDNVDLDADFRCVDNNESKYSYVSSYAPLSPKNFKVFFSMNQVKLSWVLFYDHIYVC